MNARPLTVLVVGATGSIGRLVVAEALRQGAVGRREVDAGRRSSGRRSNRLPSR